MYDDDEVCKHCGTPIPEHGDVCDPADVRDADLSRAGERAFDMAHDDRPDDGPDMIEGEW